jgi:hypothetical protein
MVILTLEMTRFQGYWKHIPKKKKERKCIPFLINFTIIFANKKKSSFPYFDPFSTYVANKRLLPVHLPQS